MKRFLFIILIGISMTSCAQNTDYYTSGGYAVDGYDVVAYFDNQAIKGNKEYISEFDGVTYKFSSEKNLEAFNKNPEKYLPEYGGYCAYAIAVKSEKVSINPKTFDIIDGKLYLFYNAWGTNTLKLWNKEGVLDLLKNADDNWNQIKFKK
jgi:YHS domain-containing protein